MDTAGETAVVARTAPLRAFVADSAQMAKERAERARASLVQLRAGAVARVKDPQFRLLTISTAGGAITLGSVGGAFGMASGIVVGSVGGAAPALLTFGLSIPAGAVIGGGTGTLVGAGAGVLGGGVAAYQVYMHQDDVKRGIVYVKTKTLDTAESTKASVRGAASTTTRRLAAAGRRAGEAAAACQSRVREVACAPVFQATSASAVACGFAGGVFGGTAGTAAGAAAGVVPALFTFGLSIPVGAAVGLCAGALAGSTGGAVGGGLVGYGGFTHRQQIRDGAAGAWNNVSGKVQQVRGIVGGRFGGKAGAASAAGQEDGDGKAEAEEAAGQGDGPEGEVAEAEKAASEDGVNVKV